MNKEGLINNLAKNLGLSTKTASDVVEAFSNTIQLALLRGEKVSVNGLGIFDLLRRKQREILHPITKEKVILPEQTTVSFRPSEGMKKTLK